MRLQDYPKLQRWYDAQDAATDHDDELSPIIFGICRAFQQFSDKGFVESITFAVRDITYKGDNDAHDYFNDIHEYLGEFDVDLMRIITDAAELSLHTGQSQTFYEACGLAATRTNLVALRFIAAWLALNINDYKGCIAHCDRVDQPFAAVYTLHGQALLESLEPLAAIDILNTAVRLDSKEPLAWFQLAKAHDVVDQYEQAWQALQQCQKIAPTNPEIALFMAMVAIKLGRQEIRNPLYTAWACMWAHHFALAGSPSYFSLMSDISLLLNDAAKLASLLKVCPWDDLMNHSEFIQLLPKILRELHVRSWHEQAKCILEAASPKAATSDAKF